MINMDSLDADTRSEILDIPKQIKANGSFDKFRKDCFKEITAQPAFANLQKQVEDFVHKFLREQNPNSKKSLIREKLRRQLTENIFLTNGIDKLIESFLEPKLDSTFKPLIHEMVLSTKSSVTTAPHTAPLASTIPSQETSTAMDTGETKSQQPQKISVEDFIPTTVATVTTTPKLGHPNPPAKLKSSKSMDKTPNSANEKTQINKKRQLSVAETPEKKQPTTPIVKAKPTAIPEGDPTNEYKFHWFANKHLFENIDYDALPLTIAIEASELSELEELNRI